jgi:hypothetical protein
VLTVFFWSGNSSVICPWLGPMAAGARTEFERAMTRAPGCHRDCGQGRRRASECGVSLESQIILYVVEVVKDDQHREFAAAMLDRASAENWRRCFDRIAGPEARAVIHPVSAAIRTARARSRSA